MLEIEKRYLLKYLPADLKDFPSVEIEDAVIDTQEKIPNIRLRRIGDKYELTKKYKKNSNSRLEMVEETILLCEQEYNTFKKLTNLVLSKTRYFYTYNNLKYEIDIFKGKLTGLCKAEIELENIESASLVKMPDFCLCDITDTTWMSGGSLLHLSFENLADELNNLGYNAITVI